MSAQLKKKNGIYCTGNNNTTWKHGEKIESWFLHS